MIFSRQSLATLTLSVVVGVASASDAVTVCASRELSNGPHAEPPMVAARTLKNGVVMAPEEGTPLSDVYGCCGVTTSSDDEENDPCADGKMSQKVIGAMPQFSKEQTLEVLASAKAAWNGGMGAWPQMALSERVNKVKEFLSELQKAREEIVNVLMWEIGKNRKDAESEFDRTIQFAEQVIDFIHLDPEYSSSWQTIGSTRAFVRRAAVGIIMCLGPMNYPLNETYATLIPALLMGNVVIMKIPTVGGLAHLLTMDAFSKTLPPGTIEFVSGGGRATMPPLMADGAIDGLAFIGGSRAADDLIRQHPHPHRLMTFLQLEAKNMGIFLEDLFESRNSHMLQAALDEAVLGSLSFNGQRCTALKMMFVPKAKAQEFSERLAQRVESLMVGLPWQKTKDGKYSQITPLPNQKRVAYMKSLIDDAVSKGAKIMNEKGGEIIGGDDSTLMVPAVLFPVTPNMDIYHEEQFGPIIPVAGYDHIDTILRYGRDGVYGQQCSIFTSDHTQVAASILDHFSSVFGKININSQCGRSPDTLPFSGRRSSAMGVMSVAEALREFSIPTVVAYKDKGRNEDIVREIQKESKFMEEL